jgi:hypothetical protein
MTGTCPTCGTGAAEHMTFTGTGGVAKLPCEVFLREQARPAVPTSVTWEEFIHADNILNANDRKHWGATSGPKQVLRTLGKARARRIGERYGRVRITAEASYPDRQPRDAMNLYPTLKSYVDGMVDGGRGILPDDSDIYVSGPFIDWSGRRSPSRTEFLFRITMEEIPPLIPAMDAMGPKMREKWQARHFPLMG